MNHKIVLIPRQSVWLSRITNHAIPLLSGALWKLDGPASDLSQDRRTPAYPDLDTGTSLLYAWVYDMVARQHSVDSRVTSSRAEPADSYRRMFREECFNKCRIMFPCDRKTVAGGESSTSGAVTRTCPSGNYIEPSDCGVGSSVGGQASIWKAE
jgi:hypothetical protein